MSPVDFGGPGQPDGGEESSTPRTSGSPVLRPAPPLAKRLNRNALTVAAVMMGMTVLTAVVVMRPGDVNAPAGATDQPANVEEAPIPARPSFLDEPARLPATTSEQTPDGSSLAEPADAGSRLRELQPPLEIEGESDGVLRERSSGEPRTTVRGDEHAVGTTDTWAGSGAELQSTGSVSQPSARERAYLAALASSILVPESSREANAELAAADVEGPILGSGLPDDEVRLLRLSDSLMRAAMQPGPVASAPGEGGGVAVASPVSEATSSNVPSDRHRAFLEAAAGLAGAPSGNGATAGLATAVRLEPSGSPYTLHAGTVVPGMLLTAINSDLPGDLVAQVSRDVYDSRTQRLLLIPRGARLIGTYDNQVAVGQGRLLVAWTRLILPDGRSMRLPGLALTDAQGRTGAAGKVDNHWRRVFGNALLLSAIGAGVQLSQPRQSSVLSTPSAGQVAAGALGQELSNVALEILRRGMDVAPTITVREGQPFHVFLNGDLVFDGPYEEAMPSVRLNP